MLGDYAASFLPAVFVPMLAVMAFAVMAILFSYVESDA